MLCASGREVRAAVGRQVGASGGFPAPGGECVCGFGGGGSEAEAPRRTAAPRPSGEAEADGAARPLNGCRRGGNGRAERRPPPLDGISAGSPGGSRALRRDGAAGQVALALGWLAEQRRGRAGCSAGPRRGHSPEGRAVTCLSAWPPGCLGRAAVLPETASAVPCRGAALRCGARLLCEVSQTPSLAS